MRHTPGPWKAIRGPYGWQVRVGGDPLADVHHGPDEVEEAAARLIAAAPDLLSALEGVAFSLEEDPDDPEWNEQVRASFAAIAKAKGETP